LVGVAATEGIRLRRWLMAKRYTGLDIHKSSIFGLIDGSGTSFDVGRWDGYGFGDGPGSGEGDDSGSGSGSGDDSSGGCRNGGSTETEVCDG
jgi:hypothetical protein